MKNIFDKFHITDEEFIMLDKKYSKLCKWQVWRLVKRFPSRSVEFEDMEQEIFIALLHAGSHYKRQTYIESCFEVLSENGFYEDVRPLEERWKADKRRFTHKHERTLEFLVSKLPEGKKPDKGRRLVIDKVFDIYCRQITFNKKKQLCKKINKDNIIRMNSVSLEDCGYLLCG